MSCSRSMPPAWAIASISSTPGHHRLAGEVAEEERLVDGDVLDRHDPLLRLDLEHAVDQQDRVAVRQHRHDPLDVPLRVGRSVTSSLALAVFSSALRRAAHLLQARQHHRLAAPLAQLDRRDAGHLRAAARPTSAPPTWPPPARRRRARCGRRPRPARRARRSRRAACCRRCRPAPQRIQCRPTCTLCPTWTRLSILVPAPIRVSPSVARSIVELAPDLDVRPRSPPRPTCGTLWWTPPCVA